MCVCLKRRQTYFHHSLLLFTADCVIVHVCTPYRMQPTVKVKGLQISHSHARVQSGGREEEQEQEQEQEASKDLNISSSFSAHMGYDFLVDLSSHL